MKKLLLVLLVVTLASFLLVGCLGEGTVVDDDDDDDDVIPPPVQAVTIKIEDQYPAAPATKEYIRADLLDVTVTFAVAVGEDDIVNFVAKEAGATVPAAGKEVTLTEVTGSGRKEWKFVDYKFGDTAVYAPSLTSLDSLADCTEICLYVTVNDCCIPDETPDVYFETVKLDDTAPVVTPTLTVKDCDPCPVVDECADPVVGGAVFEFTTLTTDEDPCDPELGNSCKDTCSGVGAWSFVVDKGECDECPTASSIGCTVVGATDCGCLPYQTAAERDASVDASTDKEYTLTFDVEDNVGNEQDTITWTITVDTDEVTAVDGTGIVEG